MTKLKTGVFISGGGSNLQAIMDACNEPTSSVEIVFVGTDNPDATGLERAKKAGIPTFTTDYSGIIRNYKKDPSLIHLPSDFNMQEILNKQTLFPPHEEQSRVDAFFHTRVAAEADFLKKMAVFDFDLIALAGFMRTFTPYFIDRVNTDKCNPRIMNIHPALLPAFPGLDGYGDTYKYGCKTAGCTVHFIDYGEDSGPIIGQRAFQINPDDTLETVREKGLSLEWQLFPECIELFAHKLLVTEYIDGRGIVRIKKH